MTVQSLILGGISLLHGDGALRPKCTIPFMSTLATMADCATSHLCREAFTFWDLSSLTFEAWTLGEHPGVRFIPASTELSALPSLQYSSNFPVHCGSECRMPAKSSAPTISPDPCFPEHKLIPFGSEREIAQRDRKPETFLESVPSNNQAAVSSF